MNRLIEQSLKASIQHFIDAVMDETCEEASVYEFIETWAQLVKTDPMNETLRLIETLIIREFHETESVNEFYYDFSERRRKLIMAALEDDYMAASCLNAYIARILSTLHQEKR